ncbi:MAG: class I SAM-dependent methyltransferase [Acidobacteriaceae bacterium]
MTEQVERSAGSNYGIDAPGVIRNMAVIGLALLIAAAIARHFASPSQYAMLWTGIWLELGSVLMLVYSRWGKLLHRDRMLNLHQWRGDEQVLDVGTGRGLLLVGAARRLTSGRATGVDIWNAADLSGNARERTEANLAREGVAARCSLADEDAASMSFPDHSFDVVLSNLCLHNIKDRSTRQRAVWEVARVLKPGGEVILSDFKSTREYARVLREAGLQVKRRWPNLLTTYPPLRILTARKPGP